MSAIPYFFSILAVALWFLAELSVPRSRWLPAVVPLALNAASFGSVCWLLSQLRDAGQPMQWHVRWLAGPAAGGSTLFLGIFLERASGFWLFLSSLAVFLTGLHLFVNRILFSRAGLEKNIRIDQEISLPVHALGLSIAAASGNLMTFCLGWSFLILGGFIAVFASSSDVEVKSRTTSRFFIFSGAGELLLLTAILAVTKTLHSGEFQDLDANAASQLPLWAHGVLLAGVLLRQGLLPVFQSLGCLASARGAARGPTVFAQMLGFGILLQKFHAVFASSPVVFIAAPMALASLFFLTLSVLAERDGSMFSSAVSGVFSALALLMALMGSLLGAETVLASAVFVLSLWWTIAESRRLGAALPPWLLYLSALATVGLPVAGVGWSKFLSYGELLLGAANPAFGQFVFGALILAGILFSVAVWGYARSEAFEARQKDVALKPQLEAWTGFQIGFSVVFLVSAFTLGFWSAEEFGASAPDLSLQNESVFSLAAIMGEQLLGFLLVVLWIRRDAATSAAFVERWDKWLKKIRLSMDWDEIGFAESGLQRLTCFFSAFLRRIDESAERGRVREASALAWRGLVRLFHGFDAIVVSKGLVSSVRRGMNGAVGAVRAIHNGAVQFYFVFGVLVTALIMFILTLTRGD